MQSIIKLDVSGRLFYINKQALMSIENTYFHSLMVNSDKFQPLEDVKYFIDIKNIVTFGFSVKYFNGSMVGRLRLRDLTFVN